MNKFLRNAALLTAAAFAASALAPTAASAASVVLTSGGTSSSNSFGNVRTFTGNDGTKLEVTGYSLNGSSLSTGFVGQYNGYGLGLTANNGEAHWIDNSGRKDILVLQFDKVVTVSSLGLYGFGDTDLSWAVGTTSTPFSDTLSITSWTAMDNLFNPFTTSSGSNSSSTSTRNVNSGAVSGNLFFVSASLSDSQNNDAFKLTGLNYTVPTPPPAVPEPASWAMMIGGLGLVGATMRRRKSHLALRFA